jgi:hypothetical protein
MKKALYLIPCLLMLALQYAYSSPKDDAAQKYNGAESLKKGLELKADLSAFIPYDMYHMGSVSLERARIALNDGKYNDAAYNATEASIRFEIVGLVAQARAARFERMKLLSDSCSTGIMTNPVMDAQFFKKGDVFRANVYDRQVFVTKKDHVYYTISTDGKERLDKIVKVLDSYPNYKMKIIGHTSDPDYNDYSKQKADVVAKYFYGKNISSDRIEIMGMGNKEVLDTHLGYRRVDRVEFILSAPK